MKTWAQCNRMTSYRNRLLAVFGNYFGIQQSLSVDECVSVAAGMLLVYVQNLRFGLVSVGTILALGSTGKTNNLLLVRDDVRVLSVTSIALIWPLHTAFVRAGSAFEILKQLLDLDWKFSQSWNSMDCTQVGRCGTECTVTLWFVWFVAKKKFLFVFSFVLSYSCQRAFVTPFVCGLWAITVVLRVWSRAHLAECSNSWGFVKIQICISNRVLWSWVSFLSIQVYAIFINIHGESCRQPSWFTPLCATGRSLLASICPITNSPMVALATKTQRVLGRLERTECPEPSAWPLQAFIWDMGDPFLGRYPCAGLDTLAASACRHFWALPWFFASSDNMLQAVLFEMFTELEDFRVNFTRLRSQTSCPWTGARLDCV